MWDSLQGACSGAGFKGIASLTAIALEMAQDAVHDAELPIDGNNSQLGAARAQQSVDFKNLSQ
jgi:hypothetical protein